jgi:NAD(P)-dependent dehydrogenase (short-subunit alcohol dehydrogenase family)
MDKIRFDGKTAIITGAGSGLGRSYAIELASRGANVVVNDIGSQRDGLGENHSPADIVVEEIRKSGGKAAANYDSVATVAGGESIVKTAIENFGSVDILINNAGILRDKSLIKMEEDDWDKLMSVHLKGAFCVTKPAFAYMKEKGYGRIIFTSSGSALYGNFGQTNYSSVKMGLIGFMNSLKIEGAKYNIFINSIVPIAASRMTKDVWPEAIHEKLSPEFVTPMAVYLSSEKCTESGMIFNCSGGWFSRSAIVCASGVIIGDGKRKIEAEEIFENRDKILNIDDGKVLNNVAESIGYLSKLLS